MISTGVLHSVQELVELAFARVGLDWREYVHIDESLRRGAAELHDLVGDSSQARDRLGWSYTLDFEGLVNLLVDADLERLARSARGELRVDGVVLAGAALPGEARCLGLAARRW